LGGLLAGHLNKLGFPSKRAPCFVPQWRVFLLDDISIAYRQQQKGMMGLAISSLYFYAPCRTSSRAGWRIIMLIENPILFRGE
jgi:hypothetical protein